MPPRFFFRCLGPPELRGPGGEPVKFRVRKHLALLAFLAAERREPHRRDRLVDLLWPDARPSEGRHSLATALSVLRARLGPRTFETSRDTVRLVAAELEVDLDRLARGDVLGDEFTGPLEVAGFLEDFEVARAPEFMFWRDLMRARWLPQIRDALVLLMDRCRRSGDFTRIEPHADRLLALDELSEDAVRAKMEARAFAGDRVSAIRLYQGWRARLEEELDATPSPLVAGMALRLRQRGYTPPGAAHVPTVATDQWQNRAFVGRGGQYRVLYERWEATRDGAGQHGLVLGDSGIGKTTLIERLVTAASLEGATSSRVQCYEVEREVPYTAIGTLVRGLLERPGASGTSPVWLAELARMIPAVAQRYRNLPAPLETTGESARLRFTEAVHELLTAVADEHPVILVVDDVHLADDASVAVLHLVMRRTQEQRIMVLLAARESELAKTPNAGRLIEQRDPLGLATVILPPLDPEEMGEVLAQLSSAAEVRLPPAVERAVLRTAAGVPMMAELLFDDWRRHGEQCLALSVGAMTVHAPGGEAPEEVYQRLFARMLGSLTPAARAVLDLAAILGDRLNDLTMYEIVDLSLAQTLAGMAELVGARVFRDGGKGVEFRYELLRAYAYFCVPSPLRRAVHGRIADRLLAAEGRGEAIPGLMLAWHCFRAGRVGEAVPRLLRGAKEAIRGAAPFEAELALDTSLPALTGKSHHRARILLAESIQEQGRWEGSLINLPETADLDSGDLETCEARRLAAQAWLPSDGASSEVLAHSIIDRLESTNDPELTTTLIPAAIKATHTNLRESTLRRLYDIVVAKTGDELPLEVRLQLATALTMTAWGTGRLDHHPGLRAQLATLSEEYVACNLACSTTVMFENSRGCLGISLGDYNAALEAFRTGFSIARTLGNEMFMGIHASNVAVALGRLGRYAEALAWNQKSAVCFSQIQCSWRQERALLWSGWCHAMLGQHRSAVDLVERLLTAWECHDPSWVMQYNGLLTADVSLLAGDISTSEGIADRVISKTGVEAASIGETGRVTRWRFRPSVVLSGGETLENLESIAVNRRRLDLFDQAEVVGALVRAKKAYQMSYAAERVELLELLSRLPEPVSTQLTRLGLVG